MRRILPVMLSLLAAVCLSLSAQQAPVLTRLEPGSCAACKVTIEYVTTIGSEQYARMVHQIKSLKDSP